MKKFLPILLAVIFFIIFPSLTDGYENIGGKVKPEITNTIWTVLFIVGLMYVFSGSVKKKTARMDMTPFVKE